MTTSTPSVAPHGLSASRALCPSWCVAAHGATVGEEDWLHTSEPVRLTADVRAHLMMSIDPETCRVDGPFLLIGDTELTLAESAALAVMPRQVVQSGDG